MTKSGRSNKLSYLHPSGILMSILLLFVLSACGSAATNTSTSSGSSCTPKISLKQFNLGDIPAENATSEISQAQPFVAALQQQLCVPVHLFVGTSYTATIEAMSSQKVDAAWYGPFSYILANSKYNAEVILRQLTVGGADHYYSYLITTPKTGIKTVAGLKGHSFSFVDPASTSGNLIPRYTMIKNGLNPDKDVKGTFTGGHDASLLAVVSGKIDAGAVASDTYDQLLSQGKFKQSDIVIINKSDPIPESPIAVRKELSQSDKDAIRAAFLAIKDPKALNGMTAGGFITTSDSDYDGLRDIAKQLNLDLTKLK